jgi:hypothetical protein
MGHRMTATVPSRYACYGRQTSNEYPAGFYGVGVGFELVACCRRAAHPGRARVGEVRARSYMQRGDVRLATA